jgi:hypothetical protein
MGLKKLHYNKNTASMNCKAGTNTERTVTEKWRSNKFNG